MFSFCIASVISIFTRSVAVDPPGRLFSHKAQKHVLLGQSSDVLGHSFPGQQKENNDVFGFGGGISKASGIGKILSFAYLFRRGVISVGAFTIRKAASSLRNAIRTASEGLPPLCCCNMSAATRGSLWKVKPECSSDKSSWMNTRKGS